MPATPMLKKVPVNERGYTAQEKKAMTDIAKALAGKFKDYIDGCHEAAK